MKGGKLLLTLLVPLGISGCGTLQETRHATLCKHLDTTMREYAQLVRWQELEGAAAHVSPSLLAEYRQRMPGQAEVKITDYRVVKMACDTGTVEGSATVEFQYYRPPSVTVRTVEDQQRWKYEGPARSGGWRLQTLLPAFR